MRPDTAPLKVGIIGARRRLQGIGEYVARDLVALGADVRAIVGTNPRSVEQARNNLRTRFDLTVKGYLASDEMLAVEDLDAVAICSPSQFHRQHLRQALKHRLHVLCEKPLVFEQNGDNPAAASGLVDAFRRERRVLMVNQQWPYTLEAFDKCYQSVRGGEPIVRFEMLLAPAVNSVDMIPSAIPHVLSMLRALAPTGGRVQQIEVELLGKSEQQIKLEYVHATGSIAVTARLIQSRKQPRPAAYAINGCTVARRLQLPNYGIYFDKGAGGVFGELGPTGFEGEPEDGWVEVKDPLRLLLADFISRIESPHAAAIVDPGLGRDALNLQRVYEVATNQYRQLGVA